jgi:hypothetical protein
LGENLTLDPVQWDERGKVNSSSQLAAVGAVFVAVLLVGAWLETKWRTYKTKKAASKLAKKGLKAEKEAEVLLKKLGYSLLQRQPPASYWAVVDGEPQNVALSGDLLVALNGKTFLAEVKTGKAVKLDHAETRRQLLEYQLAFGVDGLLLVDMEAKAVRKIRFPLPKPPAKAAAVTTKRKLTRWAGIAAVAGVAVWVALLVKSQPHHAAPGVDDGVLEHPPVEADPAPKPADPKPAAPHSGSRGNLLKTPAPSKKATAH